MLRVRSLITPTCHQHHHYKHCWPRDLQPTEEIAKRLQCVVFHLYLWHCHPDVHSSGTNCEWLCWPFKLSMNQASLLASGGYNSMCPKKLPPFYQESFTSRTWQGWDGEYDLTVGICEDKAGERGSHHHDPLPGITLFGQDSEEICQFVKYIIFRILKSLCLTKIQRNFNVQVTDLRVSCENIISYYIILYNNDIVI